MLLLHALLQLIQHSPFLLCTVVQPIPCSDQKSRGNGKGRSKTKQELRQKNKESLAIKLAAKAHKRTKKCTNYFLKAEQAKAAAIANTNMLMACSMLQKTAKTKEEREFVSKKIWDVGTH